LDYGWNTIEKLNPKLSDLFGMILSILFFSMKKDTFLKRISLLTKN